MKKFLLYFFLSVFLLVSNANAQTYYEYFETQTALASTFTNSASGQAFTLTNGLIIENTTGYGVGASATPSSGDQSNGYLDNYGTTGNGTYSIKTSNGRLFTSKSIWLYPSSSPSGNTPTQYGTVTIYGKLNGTTKFTLTIAGSNFQSTINFGSNYDGFTKIDFSTQGGTDNSGVIIDELAVNLSSNYIYIAMDNFAFALASATWTGTTSNDWATATNWTSGTVPTSNHNVIIPTAASNMPVQVTSAQSCNNLTVQSSASLTNTSTLNIYGSISNSGTITSTNGTISMAGSSAQTIAASTFSSNTIQNLTINNSSGVTLGGSLKVTGTTALTSGSLSTGGYLTIAPGGAITGTYANISGSVTLQQSIIAQRGWRVFANPFTTSQTLATVASNNAISIQTTGSSNAAGIADDRTFSNSSNTWSDGGTSIAANTPYALFIRGLASEVTGLSYTGGPTAFTYNVSGTLNGATTSVTPASTSNFIIVGNPYAAPVNSKALTGQTAGTNYYVYTITQGGTQTAQRTNTGSWVAAGSTSDATHTIPVLGVVAYKPSSTTTFNITPSDINTSGTLQTGLFGEQPPTSQIEVEVDQNGDFKDKFFVRLDPNATANGTDKADLQKFYNDNVNVYTISTADNTRMAIDARNTLNTIPLGVYGTAGDYTLKLNNDNLPEGTTVFIHDKLLNTQTELKVGEPFTYTITSDSSTYGEQRFEMVFNTKKTTLTNDPSAGSLTANVLGNITKSNMVAVEIAGAAGQVNIAVKDMNGRSMNNIAATNGIQYINVGNTVSGMLILQISDGKNAVIKKVMKF